MKVESTQNTGFNPINLTITIESKEELFELYARFNVAQVDLEGAYPAKADNRKYLKDLTGTVFCEIAKLYKEHC